MWQLSHAHVQLYILLNMAIGYKGGYIRKKAGEDVWYVNQNVRGKVKQVHRAYATEVKNPKTLSQSRHRALWVACKNFRRGFEGLLSHSWQGTKYGQPSLNRFTQLVMTKDSAQFPGFFLQPKNSMKFIPQPWPLSTGSIIAEVDFNAESLNHSNEYVYTNLIFPSSTTLDMTLGEFWASFLINNPQFNDGDMLTFCFIVQDPEGNWNLGTERFAPVFDRFIIDTSSSKQIVGRQIESQQGKFQLEAGSDRKVIVKIENAPWKVCVAAGCIVSRRNPYGTGYQRNNAVLQVASWVSDYYNSSTYRENCIRSFMDDSFLESTWYLNQVGFDSNAQGGNNWQNGNDGDTTIEEP